MNDNIEFGKESSEDLSPIILSSSTVQGQSVLVKFLIRIGLVTSTQQAMVAFAGIALLCFALTYFIAFKTIAPSSNTLLKESSGKLVSPQEYVNDLKAHQHMYAE